jgi:hypothetical protein
MEAIYPDWDQGLERTSGSAESFGKGAAAWARELEATASGCAWMLDRWAELRRVVDEGRNWRSTDCGRSASWASSPTTRPRTIGCS